MMKSEKFMCIYNINENVEYSYILSVKNKNEKKKKPLP